MAIKLSRRRRYGTATKNRVAWYKRDGKRRLIGQRSNKAVRINYQPFLISLVWSTATFCRYHQFLQHRPMPLDGAVILHSRADTQRLNVIQCEYILLAEYSLELFSVFVLSDHIQEYNCIRLFGLNVPRDG